jgi:uncharacterized membrane protein
MTVGLVAWWWLIQLLLLAAAAALIIRLLRRAGEIRQEPLAILQARLAKGEIAPDQYEEVRKALRG